MCVCVFCVYLIGVRGTSSFYPRRWVQPAGHFPERGGARGSSPRGVCVKNIASTASRVIIHDNGIDNDDDDDDDGNSTVYPAASGGDNGSVNTGSVNTTTSYNSDGSNDNDSARISINSNDRENIIIRIRNAVIAILFRNGNKAVVGSASSTGSRKRNRARGGRVGRRCDGRPTGRVTSCCGENIVLISTPYSVCVFMSE